jgi:hypothetical protein
MKSKSTTTRTKTRIQCLHSHFEVLYFEDPKLFAKCIHCEKNIFTLLVWRPVANLKRSKRVAKN